MPKRRSLRCLIIKDAWRYQTRVIKQHKTAHWLAWNSMCNTWMFTSKRNSCSVRAVIHSYRGERCWNFMQPHRLTVHENYLLKEMKLNQKINRCWTYNRRLRIYRPPVFEDTGSLEIFKIVVTQQIRKKTREKCWYCFWSKSDWAKLHIKWASKFLIL